jgi:AcrR family transcriptional regulator
VSKSGRALASREAAPDVNRRNPQSHAAILAATVELLEEVGYKNLTIEGVAQRAGVGKQTIYRWWSGSKPALVLEAFVGVSVERVPPPDTGSIRGDLLAVLQPVFGLNKQFRTGTALANKTMMAEAQLDNAFHTIYVDLHRSWWAPMHDAVKRAVNRGELVASTDPGIVVDLLLGAAWYRLLLEHAPLDHKTADVLVDSILNGVLQTPPNSTTPTRRKKTP